MSKRGENIYKRKDGRWEGRYKKGRKKDGKIKYGYVYGKSYKETKRKLIELKYKYQKKNNEKVYYYGTVEQWLLIWMSETVESNVKISTYASYQYKLKRYVIPYIGDKQLTKLNSNDIVNLINLLQEKRLSVSTINLSIGILKKSCNYALSTGIVGDDIFKNIKLIKKTPNKVKALSIREQSLLEKIAIKDKYGLPCLIALYTGLRIGEISALEWKNIDFEKNIITVSRTYQRVPGIGNKSKSKLLLSDVKTSGSNRIIPMGRGVRKWLLDLSELQNNQTFIFEIKDRPIEPRLINYRFKKMLRDTEIEDIHFHQLRHTFATRCLEAQENISVISAILGHQSVKTTLDIYTDALIGQKRIMIHKMEDHRFDWQKKIIV